MKIKLTLLLCLVGFSLLDAKIYEDAENQKTSNWRHYLKPNEESIKNIYDVERKSRVIELKGYGYTNQYIIGDDVQGAEAWRDNKHSHIQWSMQNSGGFILYLNVETSKGVRYLKYDDNYFANKSMDGDEIYHALGYEASNGKWHTYIRDIEADIQTFEPDNKLLYVDGLLVIGDAKIDDLILFDYLHPVNHQAGLVLTFDDYNVDGWYSMKKTFAEYNAKPTFFVSEFHRLSNEKVEKLKTLESIGAEIGSHTYGHKGIGRDYNYDVDLIDDYLNEQIIPALNDMRAAGFNPKSLAYPFGEHETSFDEAVRAYFPYLRTTASDNNRVLSDLHEIYHKKGKHYSILAGDGIDNSYNNEIEEIKKALIKARKNQEIVTLYGHEINNQDDDYSTSPKKLEAIIKTAQQLSLKFYNFQEAYLIGK
jgi:peptidoglycan/xylan/chitin deacetylase (PgdA/CDA1 family)